MRSIGFQVFKQFFHVCESMHAAHGTYGCLLVGVVLVVFPSTDGASLQAAGSSRISV